MDLHAHNAKLMSQHSPRTTLGWSCGLNVSSRQGYENATLQHAKLDGKHLCSRYIDSISNLIMGTLFAKLMYERSTTSMPVWCHQALLHHQVIRITDSLLDLCLATYSSYQRIALYQQQARVVHLCVASYVFGSRMTLAIKYHAEFKSGWTFAFVWILLHKLFYGSTGTHGYGYTTYSWVIKEPYNGVSSTLIEADGYRVACHNQGIRGGSHEQSATGAISFSVSASLSHHLVIHVMRNVIHAFIFRVATRTCGLLSIGNMHVAITFGVASRSLDYHVSLAIKYQQVIGAIANVRRFIISSVSSCLAKWTIAKDWERVNMDTFATICISLHVGYSPTYVSSCA
ncbi:hypothetical protein O0I10_006255 [Lichtheimia ornata]|uniref:Uncharacterized protein n=1 Tax=Lichtheimia ornata TaxID=688661 RepID=A0AAD7V279_9FUNG|nr:uncharacterized protein O0I10_006255 [Lichtheimia ornata]KAJ8657984.1 hypothetical protein O0I10_006255 [Lichtheimia ornata]